MKPTLLSILCSVFSTFIFSQNDPIAKDQITRIEVNIRNGDPSIRLLKEGLLCEYFTEVDEGKYYHISTFIPLHRLDSNKLFKLQRFIKSDSLFYKDSVFEDVDLANSLDGHGWINLLIIHPDYSSNYILWDTGESKKLEKCIKLLNDLIPENDRKVFAIEPMSYIYSKEQFERRSGKKE